MNLIPRRRNRELVSGGFFPGLSSLRTEMDSLFEQFLKGDRFPSAEKIKWQPLIDVKDNEKEISVRCEVPGVNPKDIDVSIKGDLLTIKGEKKTEKVEDTDDYYVSEREFGSFLRTIELPDSVDTDSIKAEQKDGVLMIQLKKRAGSSQKKIPIAESK